MCLRDLKHRFRVSLEFAVLKVCRALFLDVCLENLTLILGCGSFYPCRCVGRSGNKFSLACEIVQLLGAFLPEDDICHPAVRCLESGISRLCTAVGSNFFAFLIDQTKIFLLSRFSSLCIILCRSNRPPSTLSIDPDYYLTVVVRLRKINAVADYYILVVRYITSRTTNKVRIRQ